MADGASDQRAQILEALRIHGARTADELDRLLDFRPTTSGRRLIELQRQGLVLPTALTRPTRSNRQAAVYQLA